MIIAVVIGSNVVSVIKLLKSSDDLGEGRIMETNKKATVNTALILSVLFCSFNLAFLASIVCDMRSN